MLPAQTLTCFIKIGTQFDGIKVPDLPDFLTGKDSYETKMITYEPNLTCQLLRRVINLCLKTGDVPNAEKLGIITGLPKSEGLVTSCDDLRPITVGPALNRLVHKILAARLAKALVGSGALDRAQFAFLPGGDVHEPISSTISCFNDHKAHGGGCYAIYYE